VLSQEQRAFYEENGFVVIKNLLPVEDIDVFCNHFERICNGQVKPLIGMTIMKDISVAKIGEKNAKVITKIQDWQDDEVLFQYCKNPKILDIVESFTGPNIRSIHTMIIQKPAVTSAPSSRHPLHQDLLYFPFRPANRIVCSWTCMEERISRENGGLVVIPGSHKPPTTPGILPHGYPEWDRVNKMYYGIIMDEQMVQLFESKRVYLEMEKGDTVFFHPLLIHGSGANRSTKLHYRKAISCHYASADCDTISDFRGSLQEEIVHEVEEEAKRRLQAYDLPPLDFTSVWLLKSRLVRGSGEFKKI
jgi:phytanoyl-CoA hydroxylase